jgi:hypothetical protein
MTTRSGFFRNALDRLVAARQRQADRYVSGALLAFDDETLKAYGYTREDLARRAAQPF